MQQLVCLMAAGLATHPFVALLDDGVQVALSERLGRVLIVEGFCTQGLNVREAANRRRLNRLAAAVYATARATHDFHDVVVGFAAFDLLEQLVCVIQTADDRRTPGSLPERTYAVRRIPVFHKTRQ